MSWTPLDRCCEAILACVTIATALPILPPDNRNGCKCICRCCMCGRMSLIFVFSERKPNAYEIAPGRNDCCCSTNAGAAVAVCKGNGRANGQAGLVAGRHLRKHFNGTPSALLRRFRREYGEGVPRSALAPELAVAGGVVWAQPDTAPHRSVWLPFFTWLGMPKTKGAGDDAVARPSKYK